jgi:hypothetical protein
MANIKRTLTHNEINFSLLEIIGRYHSIDTDSNYYKNESTGLTFKLCERKKVTLTHPRYYLMQHLDDGDWVYISSLYPRSQGYYMIEIQRMYFKVNLQIENGYFSVLP